MTGNLFRLDLDTNHLNYYNDSMDNYMPLGLRLARDFYSERPWARKMMIAVYFDGNRVVKAFNNHKTHTISARYKTPWHRTHCELATLRQVRNPVSGTLYLYRHLHNMQTGNARPCKACEKYIKARGITKVVYTTSDGFAVERL
jgi:tRNA(Arg) A34 adenosine deaminase TadA